MCFGKKKTTTTATTQPAVVATNNVSQPSATVVFNANEFNSQPLQNKQNYVITNKAVYNS